MEAKIPILYNSSSILDLEVELVDDMRKYVGDFEYTDYTYAEYYNLDAVTEEQAELAVRVYTMYTNKLKYKSVETGQNLIYSEQQKRVYGPREISKEMDSIPTLTALHDRVGFSNLPILSKTWSDDSLTELIPHVKRLSIEQNTTYSPFKWCEPSKIEELFMCGLRLKLCKLEYYFKKLSKDKGRTVFESLTTVCLEYDVFFEMLLKYFDLPHLSLLVVWHCEDDYKAKLESRGGNTPRIDKFCLGEDKSELNDFLKETHSLYRQEDGTYSDPEPLLIEAGTRSKTTRVDYFICMSRPSPWDITKPSGPADFYLAITRTEKTPGKSARSIAR